MFLPIIIYTINTGVIRKPIKKEEFFCIISGFDNKIYGGMGEDLVSARVGLANEDGVAVATKVYDI